MQNWRTDKTKTSFDETFGNFRFFNFDRTWQLKQFNQSWRVETQTEVLALLGWWCKVLVLLDLANLNDLRKVGKSVGHVIACNKSPDFSKTFLQMLIIWLSRSASACQARSVWFQNLVHSH